MTKRYYSQSIGENRIITLSQAESHHFLHVMRGDVGDSIVLFDGSGQEFIASAIQVSRKEVTVEIESVAVISRELSIRITIASCLPKGDRQKYLIEKLVELGVARFIPLQTERSNVKIEKRNTEKMHRIVVEASKQCERNILMQIDEPIQLSQFLQNKQAENESDAKNLSDTQLWIAHPNRNSNSGPNILTPSDDAQNHVILIGPEGGFSDAEVESAINLGWQSFELGPSILRTETAAIMSASILRNDSIHSQ